MTDWQLPIVAENKPFFAIGLDMHGASVSEIFNPTLLTWNEEPSTKTSVRYVLSRQTGTGYNERFIYLALCR